MAENSQIPTHGYKLLKEETEQNLGGVLKVGSGLGPKQWLNCWLSVTIASIRSLQKIGCTPLHFWKRSLGVVFLLMFLSSEIHQNNYPLKNFLTDS